MREILGLRMELEMWIGMGMRMRRKITACGAGRPVSRRYYLFYAATMAEPDSRVDTAKRCALQKFIKSHLAAGGERSSAEYGFRVEQQTRFGYSEDGD
ncbi:hypothetical protein H8K20_11010 [Neobittarella massiliensis]|uniref:Uncharacterized protein n=1 Tax=Neobittarella massiliensis (ex Bilen et al. 2018) TaxID=2041842 RepID=A0A8J6ILP5_9FIRM|nr:hypothetical protein [Neobittarella massiliensis]MBC3516926.1 hypothetical protein [Neobittarella massiliensis]